MIKIYIVDYHEIVPYKDKALELISGERVYKALKYIKEEDTLRSITGSLLIKKYAGIKKASSKGSKEIAGKLTKAQVKEIAEIKLPDLNAYTVEDAMKIIEGTARNMGIQITE